jgi:hypothetical protein
LSVCKIDNSWILTRGAGHSSRISAIMPSDVSTTRKTGLLGPFPREATRQEILDLVHETDDVPITTWLLTFTGAAAQLARYGVTVAWRKSNGINQYIFSFLMAGQKTISRTPEEIRFYLELLG